MEVKYSIDLDVIEFHLIIYSKLRTFISTFPYKKLLSGKDYIVYEVFEPKVFPNRGLDFIKAIYPNLSFYFAHP